MFAVQLWFETWQPCWISFNSISVLHLPSLVRICDQQLLFQIKYMCNLFFLNKHIHWQFSELYFNWLELCIKHVLCCVCTLVVLACSKVTSLTCEVSMGRMPFYFASFINCAHVQFIGFSPSKRSKWWYAMLLRKQWGRAQCAKTDTVLQILKTSIL